MGKTQLKWKFKIICTDHTIKQYIIQGLDYISSHIYASVEHAVRSNASIYVCACMRNKSTDAGTYIQNYFFNPPRMIYRINSTGRENYQIKTAPSSAGKHSGHPGFLPFFIILVFFFFLYTYPPNPAATRPLFFIIYFPGFLYVFFVPLARGP